MMKLFDLNDLEYIKAREKFAKERNDTQTIRDFYRWVRGLAYDLNEGDKDLLKTGDNKRGILLIYPVVTLRDDKKPLIGVALSFPKTRNVGHGLYTISNFDYDRMNELY